MDINKVIIIIIISLISNSVCYGGDRIVPIGLNLVKLTKYKNIPKTSIYNEVISYSQKEPFGDHHGRSTNIHETVHGINSSIRNQFYKNKLNGFYAGNGYAILVSNPNLKLRQVRDYVPHSLRGYRFKLYFEDQLAHWDDTPTYHIDEWSAYIAGAECAVDDAKKDISLKEKSDNVSGALEFSIYCTALAMATKDFDEAYWYKKPQLKETIHFFLIKAEKVFFEGQELFPSEKQDLLLYNLRYHSDAKLIREFLMMEFDGIFVD
jgi:hypothetical protein